MKRRAALALLGSTIVAGCSSRSGSTEAPDTEQKRIDVLARNCTDAGEHSVTVSFSADTSQVTMKGAIQTPQTDQILYVKTKDGVGFEDRSNDEMEVRILHLPPNSESSTGGSDCAGTIDYEAEVTFSKTPSSVIVRHLTEDDGDAVLKTITTSEP